MRLTTSRTLLAAMIAAALSLAPNVRVSGDEPAAAPPDLRIRLAPFERIQTDLRLGAWSDEQDPLAARIAAALADAARHAERTTRMGHRDKSLGTGTYERNAAAVQELNSATGQAPFDERPLGK